MFVLKQLNFLPKKPIFVYTQIVLFGLNYSFKKVRSRTIILNLQYAQIFSITLPKTFVARVYKRRLILFGPFIQLRQFVKELVDLRNPNIYTGKGLRLRDIPYHVKPGKIRKR